MPAKNVFRVSEKGTYAHIYNKGIENRKIFSQDEDCEVFLSYLEGYLTAPVNSDSAKKTFTVKGRTFKGTPHQPKNYHRQVQLLAYSLSPNHFHLILHQTADKSIESFIRSLCTRYSMYFNKKYKRSGSLFAGPYKSIQVQEIQKLLLLTFYVHTNHDVKHTSFAEYAHNAHTSWVDTKPVMSFFNAAENKTSLRSDDYKTAAEKFKQDQNQYEIIKDLVLEPNHTILERRVLKSPSRDPLYVDSHKQKALFLRMPELAVIVVLYIGLFYFGLNQITASKQNALVAGVTTQLPEETNSEASLQETMHADADGTVSVSEMPTEQTSTPSLTTAPSPDINSGVPLVVIRIEDDSPFVNVRQQPSVTSEKVTTVNEGETFELVSDNGTWIEIKMQGGGIGFVSSKYVYIK